MDLPIVDLVVFAVYIITVVAFWAWFYKKDRTSEDFTVADGKLPGWAIGLSKAEVEGRIQAFVIGEWLINSVPWFQNSYIEKVACQVGVRGTRHIKGLYTVTKENILEGKKFEDGIVRSKYFIDIHNPKGAHDVQQVSGKQGMLNPSFAPPDSDYYEVPFRSLINNYCPNLIIACRALSATHEASAAIRVMATMHGIGEAAGIAAAEASKLKKDVIQISGIWVRKQISYLSEAPDFGIPWMKNDIKK